LDYMVARRYNPALGRFISYDPALTYWTTEEIMDHNLYGLSPYVYVRNNPIIFIDPDGFTDRKAFFKGLGRSALGVGGVVAGAGLIIKGAGLAPVSGGASTGLAVGGAAVIALSASEVAFGIADMKIAANTPEGVSAEQFNTFLGIIAEQLGADKTSQEVMNMASDIITGGGLHKIGKLAADDNIIRAVIQSGVLSEDIMNILQAYEQEHVNKKKDDVVVEDDDEKN